jgi:hypothetical protein
VSGQTQTCILKASRKVREIFYFLHFHEFPGQNQRKTENPNTIFIVGMILGVGMVKANNYFGSSRVKYLAKIVNMLGSS